MTSVPEILGPAGKIAGRLAHYEHRPQQLAMAEAVAAALAEGQHLIVEAGTGVGKSFAYLVPAILYATAEPPPAAADDEDDDKPRRRIVISTHTISLQEQLLQKDLPLLRSVIPEEFTAVLVKGRGNYLSLRRMNLAAERAVSLFSSEEEMRDMRQIIAWSKKTGDGSLSDLPFRPAPAVWDEVQSDSGNCLGRKCPTYKDCFYFRARRRVQNAQTPDRQPRPVFQRPGPAADRGEHPARLRRGRSSTRPTRWKPSPAITWASASRPGRCSTSLNKLYNDRTNKGLLVTRKLPRGPGHRRRLPHPGRRVLRRRAGTLPASRPIARAGFTHPIKSKTTSAPLSSAWPASCARCRRESKANRKSSISPRLTTG